MDFTKFLMDFFIFNLIIFLVSFGFDLLLGDPPSKLHPVIWIGKIINFLRSKLKSKSLYTPKKDKMKGILITLLSLFFFLVPLGTGFYLIKKYTTEYLGIYGILIYTLITAIFLKISYAFRCLRDSTMPIAREIENGNLDKAKSYLSLIVRRDPKNLTEKQVISAAVESIAESSVDGITSPIFYFFIFNLIGCIFKFEWTFLGVLGAIGFRIVNTLDSMVGYKTPEYVNIGWFSAKSDTILNFIPERITTIMMLLACFLSRQNPKNAYRILRRDRNKVESVNAGWSMSCMAGALRVQLEKPEFYRLGDPLKELEAKNIKNSLKMINITFFLFIIFMIIIIFLIQLIWYEIILKDVFI